MTPTVGKYFLSQETKFGILSHTCSKAKHQGQPHFFVEKTVLPEPSPRQICPQTVSFLGREQQELPSNSPLPTADAPYGIWSSLALPRARSSPSNSTERLRRSCSTWVLSAKLRRPPMPAPIRQVIPREAVPEKMEGFMAPSVVAEVLSGSGKLQLFLNNIVPLAVVVEHPFCVREFPVEFSVP